MATSAENFNVLVSGTDYPMLIVTTAAGGDLSGCLVGFATQASIAPPRLIVMMSKANHTYQVARRSEFLAVHFLHHTNHDLAVLFGEETGDQVDKFRSCEWTEGPEGTPLLLHTRGWVLGRVMSRLDSGDHVAHLLETIGASASRRGGQLNFRAVRDMTPGHPADDPR